MITLNKEELEFCETHRDIIVKIVRSASASYISPEYREGLVALGKKYKFMDCSVCNSSLYLGTCRLYKIWNLTKEQLDKEQPQEQNQTQEHPQTQEQHDNDATDEKPKRGRKPKEQNTQTKK